MREIKFRAKELNTGKWVYGSLVNNRLHECCIVYLEGDCSRQAPVDPETVGQFISKTVPGVDLFEDDIVKHGGHGTWPEMQTPIVFNKGRFETDGAWVNDYEEWDFKIIGNTHDNPELLEKNEST